NFLDEETSKRRCACIKSDFARWRDHQIPSFKSQLGKPNAVHRAENLVGFLLHSFRGRFHERLGYVDSLVTSFGEEVVNSLKKRPQGTNLVLVLPHSLFQVGFQLSAL